MRTVLFISVLGMLASTTALAQPSGSYSKSCKDCLDDSGQLTCQCSYKGKYSGTSIYYGLCEGDIWNDKSKLKCSPRGSFKRSCSYISWNATRLQATCKKKNGGVSGAVLPNWPGCSGDIANCDGVLTCGSCS